MLESDGKATEAGLTQSWGVLPVIHTGTFSIFSHVLFEQFNAVCHVFDNDVRSNTRRLKSAPTVPLSDACQTACPNH